MNTEQLREWIIKYDIKQRATKYFWKYIKNYSRDEPDDYNKVFKNISLEEVSVELRKISLCITYYDNDFDTVECLNEILYDHERLARYYCEFSLDGVEIDDSLIFD